jgi:hypothetical protein
MNGNGNDNCAPLDAPPRTTATPAPAAVPQPVKRLKA